MQSRSSGVGLNSVARSNWPSRRQAVGNRPKENKPQNLSGDDEIRLILHGFRAASNMPLTARKHMEEPRFALRILYAVIFSFVLWCVIWFLVVGVNGGRSFEIVHVTRPFTGLPGFLYLALYSSLFSVPISSVMALILPDAMEERGWLHPAAWAIGGAILGELTVWVAGILLFVLAKVA